MTRKLIVLSLASVLFLSGVHVALAASHGGRIERLHYNSTVPGRNVCVRTVPDLPGTGWICLYDQHLSKEIEHTLRFVYESGRFCNFFWSRTDAEHHAILETLECYSS